MSCRAKRPRVIGDAAVSSRLVLPVPGHRAQRRSMTQTRDVEADAIVEADAVEADACPPGCAAPPDAPMALPPPATDPTRPLPPGPDKLFDLGWRIYVKIVAVVEPNWGPGRFSASWETISLSPAQQRGMDQSRSLLLEAAAQGHMNAQALCGNIYDFAQGVAEDDRLAFVYYEMAARQ